MAKKIRASLLGQDINLLKNVAKRVVQNRPAEVKYFTEVKEFLMDSMNDKPDIVAVSVNYPHKNAGQFAKVFKMALNIPVIAFGENQETKTRKNLSVTKADYKIAGVLTAHNFWMKLVNFQKAEEAEQNRIIDSEKNEEKELQEENEDTQIKKYNTKQSSNPNKNKKEPKINKGEFEKILEQDENSIIDSLFAQINDETSDNKNKTMANVLSPLNQDSLTEDKAPNTDKNLSSNKEEKSSEIVGSKPNKTTEMSLSADDPMPGTIKKSSSFQHIHGEKNKNLSSIASETGAQKLKNKKPSEAISSKGIFSGDGSESEEENRLKDKKSGDKPELSTANKNSTEGSEEKLSNNDRTPTPAIDGESQDSSKEDEIKTNNEEAVKAPNIDEKGRVKLTDKKDLEKREREKNKEKRKKDSEKLQNILQECCEEATKNILFSKSLKQPREFVTTNISVFTVELEGFKGFLLVAESFNQGFENSLLESLRNNIIDLIKAKGYVAELSSPYIITIPESNYTEVVKEACDFTIYEEEETGKQIALSYLQREVTLPQYEDSDKEGMIMVDMKTIPPKTPVNFDAFIYLPRNKRFVRYLKEGRSLSLKQVKRHIEEKVPCKLYLPKNNKAKLIQFFIQNTISWEFISYSSDTKKTA